MQENRTPDAKVIQEQSRDYAVRTPRQPLDPEGPGFMVRDQHLHLLT